MPKLSQAHVVSLLILSLAIAVVAVLVLRYNTIRETQEAPEIFSVAGKVASVGQEGSSFTVLQSTDGQSFSVLLRGETDISRLLPPFDMANPPDEATFTLEKESAAIKDIQEGDQVFVRSSHAIGPERRIVNPLEVQILP